MPGLWRLRLPLTPWPAVPHVNAYAIRAGEGVVLVDTGLDEPDALENLGAALGQIGARLEDVRLVVCTHAHADHYGLAGPILDVAGCELWMHPDHAHATKGTADPERSLERRIEVARQSGVPEEALREYREARQGERSGIARVVEPDRDLVRGVEVETDVGTLHVHETPGHAPSHVCLHQPERGLLLSGDHLLGRVSLYFDYGWTPDPAGEFLRSLDVVDALDVRLCLAGHGRPFRDVRSHIGANRHEVAERIRRVRGALREGPKTPFELVPVVMGTDDLNPMLATWGLSQALCYLRHLEACGEVAKLAGEEPERWGPATAARAAS
jgi:glyoxylase-like metal-dependent hydrolase (beta-lactamase superfamily II)